MKAKNQFLQDARKEFRYLETEFHFNFIDRESDWWSHDINYKNGGIQIRISFQHYDNLFYIYITKTNVISNSKILPEKIDTDFENEINFTQQLYGIKSIDKNKLSPIGHSNYSETMKYQAKLLKEYGKHYLINKM